MTAGDLLRPILDTCTAVTRSTGLEGLPPPGIWCPAQETWLATSQGGWVAIVFLAIWAFHFRVAARDRSAVGEAGASATLRRWYMYGVLLIALLVMLYGASGLIELAWLRAAKSSLADYRYLGDPAGLALAALAVWGFHAYAVRRNHLADDRNSTLRAVQGFIVVRVPIPIALFPPSQILHYPPPPPLPQNNHHG